MTRVFIEALPALASSVHTSIRLTNVEQASATPIPLHEGFRAVLPRARARTMRRLWLVWREWIGALAIAAIVSVATLAWVGYRAVYGWQRSAEALVQRASDSGADLLVRTITRDMRGVQTSVLPSLQFEDNEPDALLDVNTVASAFARYPYPELFFGGRRWSSGEIGLAFYSRAARAPSWLPLSETDTPFPVIVSTYDTLGDRLIARVERDARVRRSLSVFDIRIGDATYQAILRRSTMRNSTTTRVNSVRGFLVNRDWVRQHYFGQLVTQIASTGGSRARHSVLGRDG
ncbi:MAG: hypothetical protein QM736_29725 [Vicinamibacterales bacterium]